MPDSQGSANVQIDLYQFFFSGFLDCIFILYFGSLKLVIHFGIIIIKKFSVFQMRYYFDICNMSINLKSLEILNNEVNKIMFIAYHASYCTYFLHLLCISRCLTKFLYFNSKLTHHYNTRDNFRKKMDNLEQENRELREEVSTLKVGMANLIALMETLVAAQNQPPSVQPQPTRETTEAPTVPVSATPVVVQNCRP